MFASSFETDGRSTNGPVPKVAGDAGKRREGPGLDWAAYKRLAFGPLSLKPNEFWNMSPLDFHDLYEGYQYRMEQDMIREELNRYELAAWVQSNLMRAWGAKVKPEQLFNRNQAIERIEKERKRNTSQADRARMIEEAKKRGIMPDG